VCTPARLNDIIENHPQDIELADVEMFVVDEVDCMLSMGFETQVRGRGTGEGCTACLVWDLRHR
jgi:superfamily II DNA/RNA helicase